MEAIIASLMLVVGLAVGAAAAWWLRGRELLGERAAAEATAALRQQGHEREIAALTDMRGEIESKMQALAAEALKGNQESFLTLAEQVFVKHREGAAATLEQRQRDIAALLAPITKSLEEYKTGLGEIEKARSAAYGGLSEEMKALVSMQSDASAQTRRLVNALRAAPKTRGRWGEHQLHNVMELSGMSPYCDFITEQTIVNDDGRVRPDVIIRLPGERRIVVDAKTSMAAYLDAVEAVDDDVREAHLVTHARQLRTHMRLLSGKAYWDALPVTPDFVAMFIPGENFYAAAIERDPQLFEDAISSKVLIVTPDDPDRADQGDRRRLAAGDAGPERAADRQARPRALPAPDDDDRACLRARPRAGRRGQALQQLCRQPRKPGHAAGPPVHRARPRRRPGAAARAAAGRDPDPTAAQRQRRDHSADRQRATAAGSVNPAGVSVFLTRAGATCRQQR